MTFDAAPAEPFRDEPPTRRLMLVHAHPDDETIGTGATMARYAAEGTAVTLITCTLGEEGEIFLPELAQLAAGQADQLGGYRIGELAAACAALGVRDQRFLGGPGRYRDSGMMGQPSNDHPRSFWSAPLDEAAALLVPIIREARPQVLITYDPDGFYGHPDHIKAHQVATRGVQLAADPAVAEDGDLPWQVSKVYWTAVPTSALLAGMETFSDSEANPFRDVTDPGELPFGTPDDEVTAAIVATAFGAAKEAAMRAHASQIAQDSWLYALAAMDGPMGVEHYRLAIGRRGPGQGRHNWETDLFAGLEL